MLALMLLLACDGEDTLSDTEPVAAPALAWNVEDYNCEANPEGGAARAYATVPAEAMMDVEWCGTMTDGTTLACVPATYFYRRGTEVEVFCIHNSADLAGGWITVRTITPPAP
jgi:hypothetical protein